MALRRAHGRGASALVRVETLPADELPAASPDDTVGSERGPDGRFLPGNRTARAKRLRPGVHGAIDAAVANADPLWRTCERWGRRYAAHRRRELAKLHGGEISAGVGGMIESAGTALADARYLRAKAAAEGDDAKLVTAARLAGEASQLEAKAWEYASREAAARPKRDPLADLRARMAADVQKREEPKP